MMQVPRVNMVGKLVLYFGAQSFMKKSLGLDPNIVKSLLATDGKSDGKSNGKKSSTNNKSTTNTTFSGLDPKMFPGVDPKVLQGMDPKTMQAMMASMYGIDPKMLA